MANAFLSETDTAVGTGAATIYTCPSSTETTVIGLSVYHCKALTDSRQCRAHSIIGKSRQCLSM